MDIEVHREIIIAVISFVGGFIFALIINMAANWKIDLSYNPRPKKQKRPKPTKHPKKTWNDFEMKH